jgi:RimJ/RimL family protein N-acetyltransferase
MVPIRAHRAKPRRQQHVPANNAHATRARSRLSIAQRVLERPFRVLAPSATPPGAGQVRPVHEVIRRCAIRETVRVTTTRQGHSRVSVSREIRPSKRAVKESSVDVPEADAGNPVVTLSDDVVTLRPWSRDDAGLMAEACSDPAIRRYNGVLDRLGRPTPPLSIVDAEAVIDQFALNWRAFATTGTPSGVAFAIINARSGDLVGCCGVDDWSKTDVAQFGYWICASARGRGYATRAVILLTRWLFELGAARVFLTIVAENEESVAVARRAGFVYEGTMRSSRAGRQLQ